MRASAPTLEDTAAALLAAASLFADPGARAASGASLEEDCQAAAEDPDHVPAHDAVAVMLALCPELRPAPGALPPGMAIH